MMPAKRILTTVCLLLALATSAGAQMVRFHINGGVASHYGGSTRNVGAFQIGLGYEVELGGMWSVEPQVLFAAKGCKGRDILAPVYDDKGNQKFDDDEQPIYGYQNTNTGANYIEVPVLVHYYLPLAAPHDIQLSVGPYVAYGIGGKTKFSGDTQQQGADRHYYDRSTFSLDGARRLDLGARVGVGYALNRQLSIGLAADLGLLPTTRDGGNKNVAWMLSFTYNFNGL